MLSPSERIEHAIYALIGQSDPNEGLVADWVTLGPQRLRRIHLSTESSRSVNVHFLRHLLALHLDSALVLARGGKVVGKLHAQPRLLRAAEGLG
jgi:hypothetical protein